MAQRRNSDRRPRTYSDDFYIGMSTEYGQLSTDRHRRQRARKRAAARRRRNNRIKIVVSGILLLAIIVTIVVLICTGIKSCINGDSTETGGFKTADTSGSNKSNKSTAPKKTADDGDPLSFITPEIKDDNTNGTMSGPVYIWKDSAYEVFGASADRSDFYSDVINEASNSLGDDIKVYSIMVPLHAEMNLPQRLKDESGCTSQADNIYNAYSKFEKAQPINVYNTLALHNSEYIYFKSDHHWTGLGAYYAYTAFCEQTNQKPMTISEEGTHKIDGFTGSLCEYKTGLSDTVYYYDLPYNTSCKVYYSPEEQGQDMNIYYELATGGENTYGVFINGDTPIFKIDSECNTGKKIAVVKESFGNAFVPYLSANYSQIHVLDMRSCGITNLKQYCEDNEIEEVLFINGIMSANSGDRITDLENLIGK